MSFPCGRHFYSGPGELERAGGLPAQAEVRSGWPGTSVSSSSIPARHLAWNQSTVLRPGKNVLTTVAVPSGPGVRAITLAHVRSKKMDILRPVTHRVFIPP